MKVSLPVRPTILKRQTCDPPPEGRLHKIRLDFNENTAGCLPTVIRALAKPSPKRLAMYPEYELSTQELARYFGVRADELLIVNGGDDALRVFFDVFVEQGSSILLREPTFSMYRYYAEIFGVKIQACRYDSTMKVPFEDVLRALREIDQLLKDATHTAVVKWCA